MVICKCPHFVHIQIVCVMPIVHSQIVSAHFVHNHCAYSDVLLLMATCKCPHFVHIQIVCVITDGHM